MTPLIPEEATTLLVVEGQGDKVVFQELLLHLGLPGKFHILECGGKDRLGKTLSYLITDDRFLNIRAIGIICDNDYPASRGNETPLENVAKHISFANSEATASGVSAQLDIPLRPREPTAGIPKVSVLLLPSDDADGAVEDLIFKAIGQDQIMDCVDDYLRCLTDNGLSPQEARIARAKLSVYVSGKSLDSRHANSDDARRPFLTDAVRAKWWRDENMWGHPAFNPAKAFLTQLLAD